MMPNGNTPQRPSPKTPTVGAGSSQREDSPAHPPASFNMAFPTQRFLCHPFPHAPRPPPYSLPLPQMLPFRALFPLEYGGLKPILPFLEDRSDAACRVVIKAVDPHGRHGMRIVVAMDGIWNAKRHATAIPPNANCRGRVFPTRRFPRPSPHSLQTPTSAPCTAPLLRVLAIQSAHLPAYSSCR